MNRNSDLLTSPLLLPLFGNQIVQELRTQLAAGNYLSTPERTEVQPDQTFASNQPLWEAVLSERLRSGTTIRLENFLLFEWFPRSPGLYYTDRAKHSREEALHYTIEYPVASQIKGIDDANKSGKGGFVPDFMRIFDPYGKIQMLHGGIGSIRLQDKVIDGVGSVWFMAASSTSTAHEGFPLAVPDRYYQQYIDQISTQGVAPCTILGKLRFVPDTLGTLYQDYTGVPQLYLLVEDVKPSARAVTQAEIPRVSVAVMFRSEYGGGNNIFASYVTFFPSMPGSLASRVDWLENTYVRSMYQGEIITDFDEQKHRFDTARFSLQKVLDKQVSMAQVEEWERGIHITGDPTFVLNVEGLVHIQSERIAQMTYQEKVIEIGDNTTITGSIVIADSIQNSFNTLGQAQMDDEAKRQLKELLKAITELNKIAPPEKSGDAQGMARDAKNLVEEAASSKPRAESCRSFLENLKQAAINIGDIAKPILGIVEKLVPLLVLAA